MTATATEQVDARSRPSSCLPVATACSSWTDLLIPLLCLVVVMTELYYLSQAPLDSDRA